MSIGDKVKWFYTDHKGNDHLSLQDGTIVGFEDYYGYPGAIVHWSEYVHPSFTLLECFTNRPMLELKPS